MGNKKIYIEPIIVSILMAIIALGVSFKGNIIAGAIYWVASALFMMIAEWDEKEKSK